MIFKAQHGEKEASILLRCGNRSVSLAAVVLQTELKERAKQRKRSRSLHKNTLKFLLNINLCMHNVNPLIVGRDYLLRKD